MSAFGAVPGLTIFTMGSVIVLGVVYLVAATYVCYAGDGRPTWKFAAIPVALVFALTTALALISTIAENQFVTHVTGG
ncbi:MAG: hypothetical protein ACREN1_00485 [Candidatus Dormibacteria bacterium]